MRRLLLLMSIVIIPIAMHANKWKFGLNKALEASFGYAKLYNSFGEDSYGNQVPTNLLALDVYGYGVYVGMDFWEKKTGHVVYGFDETIATWILKLGPSFRLGNEYSDFKIALSPYLGMGWYTVNDTSNNAIGQRQDYGLRKSKFLYGGKITFAYKQFEIGAFGSNLEYGLTIGANIDMW